MDRVQYESRMETQGCTLGSPSGAAATCVAPHQLQGLTTSRSSVRQSPSLWLKLVILHPLAFPQFWRSSAVSIHLLICSISGKSCATALQVLSYLRLLLSQPLSSNCSFRFSHVQLHSYFYLCATALSNLSLLSMSECFFLSVPSYFSTYFFTWIRNYDCSLEWVKFSPQGNPVLISQQMTLQ